MEDFTQLRVAVVGARLKEVCRYNASVILRDSSGTPVSHSTISIMDGQSHRHCLVPATFDQMNPGTTYSTERSSGSFKQEYQETPTHSWVIPLVAPGQQGLMSMQAKIVSSKFKYTF